MSKRSLPKRTSRGQLPQKLRIQPVKVKTEKKPTQDNQFQIQKRELEVKRKNCQIINLKKYPFGRAMHYFVDLDNFPRIDGHISYALNQSNYFSLTFSKDENSLKGCQVGDVLNRNLFGLPCNESGSLPTRKENKCKNVCYGYLFETEDKKHNLDRIIYTYKMIINLIKKNKNILALQKITSLKKDLDMDLILNGQVSQEQKISLLQEKLDVLESRKNANITNWEAEDCTYFYHALNQKFHDAVFQLKKYITPENIVSLVNCKDNITNLKYYYFNTPVFPERNVNSPFMCIYYEKYQKMFKIIGPIIARRCEHLNEVHYYQVKNIINRMFGYQIHLKSSKFATFDGFSKTFRKKNQEIRKWCKNLKKTFQKVQYPKMQDCSNSSLTQISGQQFMLAIVCFWLMRIFTELQALIQKFPQLISIISSQYFPKICNPLVEAINLPLAGMIYYVLEAISDIFTKPDPLLHGDHKILWKFDQERGVGMIWKENREDCNKEEQSQPSKKTKLN